MIQRGSGILLPIFSLPGRYGIGGFSGEARKLVDFLAKAGQKYWQILPLGPTSYGDSPYQAFSTFALNPYFINPDTLVAKGLLTKAEAKRLEPEFKENVINYEWLYNTRFEGLKPALRRFVENLPADYETFTRENADWVYDYALFMAIKNHYGDVSFEEWPEEVRKHEEEAINKLADELSESVSLYMFMQYEAYTEWMDLKRYANSAGIKIIGDIPIYVAYDSSDVWTNPELFQMDENGFPKAVAGCPPDGFSADGQLWGNPLYDWDYHKNTEYKWWCRRIEKCKELYDILRIDHFRGFDEYYAVPYGDDTARNGKWMPGPGISLFEAIKTTTGESDIIAEDLGFMTDSVRDLVKATGFPNMKVLEFAFDSRDSSGPSEYLPHTYNRNCVVYTGTHDNETIAGWLKNIQPAEKKLVKNYLGVKKATNAELVPMLVRLAQSSVADLCVIPMQDYLGLDNEARTNHPSTLGGNWVWRMDSKALKTSLATSLREIAHTYGR